MFFLLNLLIFASIRSSHCVFDQIRSLQISIYDQIRPSHPNYIEIHSYIKLSIINPNLSIKNPRKVNLLFKNLKKIYNER